MITIYFAYWLAQQNVYSFLTWKKWWKFKYSQIRRLNTQHNTNKNTFMYTNTQDHVRDKTYIM